MKSTFIDCPPFLHALYRGALARIVPDLEINPGSPSAGEVIRLLADSAFAMNDHTMMDEALLKACPSLRAIVFLGSGAASYIDLEAAERQGIRVRSFGGYGDQSVAEHALALMFAAGRRIALSDREIRSGHWEPHNGVEFAGKTLGVIGTGGIGQRMIRLGAGIGMRVVAWNRSGVPDRLPCAAVSLDDLLGQADVISIHLALNRETDGFLNRARIVRIKPSAIFINTARAALVDEAALIEALGEHRIAHAGLDVFTAEPLSEDDPITSLDNVTLTAHTAFATREASERLLRMGLEILAEERAASPAN